MEKKVGMELFYTDTPGIGGRLKKYPEDFRVREDIKFDKLRDGEYTIAKVWSRNWETNRLIKKMALELGLGRDDIAFSGTKDKRAITEQYMSFYTSPDEVRKIELKDLEITDMKRSHRPLYLGMHHGNHFEITIREIDTDDLKDIVAETSRELTEAKGFPNWFGVQRFGTIRPVTHEIGRKIIMGDIEGAVKSYIGDPYEKEGNESYEARKFIEDTWDYEKALDVYPNILSFERSMIKSLVKKPEDYVRALRRLPHNLQKMFIHAYQSYLFNRMLSKRLKEGLPLNDAVVGDILLPANRDGLPNRDTPVEVKERNLEKSSDMVRQGKAYVSAPLVGHNSSFSEGRQGEIEREVMDEEGLMREDFVIPELRNLSSSGTRRALFAPITDFGYDVDDKAVKLSFYLYKGTYATTLLREFMKLPDDKAHLYS